MLLEASKGCHLNIDLWAPTYPSNPSDGEKSLSSPPVTCAASVALQGRTELSGLVWTPKCADCSLTTQYTLKDLWKRGLS